MGSGAKSKRECRDQGPKVNESLAKSLNRGTGNNFSIKSALEFTVNYQSPENCDFCMILSKLNEELFFEESIASRFKKNDSVLQKNRDTFN